jgi:predicted MFS family arabinose efflux permease
VAKALPTWHARFWQHVAERPALPNAPNAPNAPKAHGSVVPTALALGLMAAVSLGLARFSYALLLPAMRADLGWTYFTAGAMNTVNALGYLIGALIAPRCFARWDARGVMLTGALAAALLLMAHGHVRSDAALYALRLLTGVASAAGFVGGGLLAARLATRAGAQPGQVLGLYYGGTGLGIVASAVCVPPLSWPTAWIALGAIALLATGLTSLCTRDLAAPPTLGSARAPLLLRPFAFGLAAYAMFGLGYIGYMTFIVTLLREQGLAGPVITAFYVLLGLGVLASSWLWAGLLQRQRGGVPLAVLNGLLAVATLLPVVSTHLVAVFASGALFGGVFLSLVASTTALVRHNAEPAAWASGIAAFTVVFAAGQIVGPSLVGLIADGGGGLKRGLWISTLALASGAVLASWQKPLHCEGVA